MPNGPPTFEELLEAAPDAMVGLDAAGVAVFANGRAKELLGRDPIGEPLGELPTGWSVARSPMGEYELVVIREMDPRALRAVLDNTTAAIFLKDPEGRYLLVNRAFERLHGKPASQPDRPAGPRGAPARGGRPDAGRRPARDVLAGADRAPGGGHARRADADVPLGQVPADRRAHRRGLRRRRDRDRHHAPRPAGGAPAGGAAAGGRRPARGRRRARLQQPARGGRQLRGVRAQGAARRLAHGRRRGPDHRRLAPRVRAHAPAAAVLAPPVRHARGAVAAARDRVAGAAPAPHARRGRGPAGGLRRPAVGRRGRPQPARADADEPRDELARGDAGRREAADRGHERRHARPGRPELARRAA